MIPPESTAQAIAEEQAAKDRELLAALEEKVKAGAVRTLTVLPPNRAERRARRVAKRNAAVRTTAIDPTARGRGRTRRKREASRLRARG